MTAEQRQDLQQQALEAFERDLPALRVGEPEVVLGDGIAALGLGPERGDFGGFFRGRVTGSTGGRRAGGSCRRG